MSFVAAVFRPVGLGEHAADLVPVLDEPPQRRHGKIRRPHKENPHLRLTLLLVDILLQLLVGQQVVSVLHEQVAVQMLNLVAEAAGRQPLALDLEEDRRRGPVRAPVRRLGASRRRTCPERSGSPPEPVCSPSVVDDLWVDQLDDLLVLVDHDARPGAARRPAAPPDPRRRNRASVSFMSSSSVCKRPLNSVTGRQTFARHSSPCSAILLKAISKPSSGRVGPVLLITVSLLYHIRLQSVNICMPRFSGRFVNSFMNAAMSARRVLSFFPITVTR